MSTICSYWTNPYALTIKPILKVQIAYLILYSKADALAFGLPCIEVQRLSAEFFLAK